MLWLASSSASRWRGIQPRCYTPLVDKVNALQAKLVSDQVLIDDAVKTLRTLETRNEHLRKDLELMQRWIPREVLAQFFDAPYRN